MGLRCRRGGASSRVAKTEEMHEESIVMEISGQSGGNKSTLLDTE